MCACAATAAATWPMRRRRSERRCAADHECADQTGDASIDMHDGATGEIDGAPGEDQPGVGVDRVEQAVGVDRRLRVQRRPGLVVHAPCPPNGRRMGSDPSRKPHLPIETVRARGLTPDEAPQAQRQPLPGPCAPGPGPPPSRWAPLRSPLPRILSSGAVGGIVSGEIVSSGRRAGRARQLRSTLETRRRSGRNATLTAHHLTTHPI